VEIYIDLIVEQVNLGGRPTYTLSKKAWTEIQGKFRQMTRIDYQLLQFKNKFQKLKDYYKQFKKLLGVTRFGWNVVTQTIIADEECWEEYINVYMQ